MSSLSRLGFSRGIIFESIVTTSGDGEPNAAPMGVTTEDMRHVVIRPYRSTRTYKNLTLTDHAIINFTDNPRIFYKTALKQEIDGKPLSISMFEKATAVPRLKDADAYIESSIIKREDETQDRAKFTFKVDYIKVVNPYFKPYCRALPAVIEATIHATRIKYFLSQGMGDEADKLITMVKHYDNVVEKVAPNSDYARIIGEILASIKSMRKT